MIANDAAPKAGIVGAEALPLRAPKWLGLVAVRFPSMRNPLGNTRAAQSLTGTV